MTSAAVVGAIGAPNASAYLARLNPVFMVCQMLTLSWPFTPLTFEGSHYDLVNGSLWTIPYEFVCYLLVMVMGLTGILASPRVTVALWLATLIAFVVFRAHDASGETAAIMTSNAAR